MIAYTHSLEGIRPELLHGFFDGWPNPPTPETHLALLQNSAKVVLALDEDSGQVVGFINALTDDTLMAFIPLLEVLPVYRGRGIATELVRRMLALLDDFYAVDLICDAELQPFYEHLGLRPAGGMLLRRYERQSGRRAGPTAR